MRIAYVGPLPPIPGGIAQYGAHLVDALRAMDVDVRTFSWRNQYPKRLYPGEQADPRALRRLGHTLAWWSVRSWFKAGRAARDADALVFSWVTPIQAPPLRVMRAAARATPSIAVVHNPIPHERRSIDLPLTRLALRGISGAIVHGSRAAEDLHRLVGDIPVEIVPLPPLIDVSPSPLPPSPPVRALFVGYVRPYKGLDVAIDAVARLKQRGQDITLTVAGEFWEPIERYREQVADTGATDIVTFRPGYVSDDEMRTLLATHHVVLLPYKTATASGLAPLARAAGRPVVASAVGSLHEQIVDGVTGILAAPGDPEGFAGALEQAIERLPALHAGSRGTAGSWDELGRTLVKLAERVGPS